MNKGINDELFTKRELAWLVIPLMIEQFLAVFIGITDTIMVSAGGEAAVSGISLVDSINVLLIQVLTALATGGAIVASQYIGKGDYKNASSAAKQLYYSVALLSVLIMAVSIIFNRPIIRIVFGAIEQDVMQNAQIYFLLSAVSYPFLALYNSSAALFRAMGNSKVTMYSAFLMNAVHIVLNAILIYGFKMGVLGAGISTLLSRALGAVVLTILLYRNTEKVNLYGLFKINLKMDMIKRILKIGIPNGIENGIFQVGRLMVASLVSTFGTSAIAANAVGNTAGSFVNIPSSSIGLCLITVVGQCMGAGRERDAERYTKWLFAASLIANLIFSLLLYVFRVPYVRMFELGSEGFITALSILSTYAIFTTTLWSSAFVLPYALRAAGDVKYTLIVSMISMWAFRIACSYLLAIYLNFGVYGVWYAMYIDWAVRSLFFTVRFARGRWKSIKVI